MPTPPPLAGIHDRLAVFGSRGLFGHSNQFVGFSTKSALLLSAIPRLVAAGRVRIMVHREALLLVSFLLLLLRRLWRHGLLKESAAPPAIYRRLMAFGARAKGMATGAGVPASNYKKVRTKWRRRWPDEDWWSPRNDDRNDCRGASSG